MWEPEMGWGAERAELRRSDLAELVDLLARKRRGWVKGWGRSKRLQGPERSERGIVEALEGSSSGWLLLQGVAVRDFRDWRSPRWVRELKALLTCWR